MSANLGFENPVSTAQCYGVSWIPIFGRQCNLVYLRNMLKYFLFYIIYERTIEPASAIDFTLAMILPVYVNIIRQILMVLQPISAQSYQTILVLFQYCKIFLTNFDGVAADFGAELPDCNSVVLVLFQYCKIFLTNFDGIAANVGTVLPDFIREKTKFDSLCQLFTRAKTI